MLVVRLDSSVPLMDQVVRGIRQALATGELGAGDELPSVRQLAADLGINLNTVARAYRELTAQGFVTTARGRGTRVVAVEETRGESKTEAKKRVAEGLRRALVDAKLAGLSPEETEEIVRIETARIVASRREVRS